MVKDVIYFDNAATSWPKPPVVVEAMARFLAEEGANPGRAGHRMALAAEKRLDRVRRQLTEFVGGDDPSRLVFAMNGTDALNIALKSLLRRGDHVITSTLEHNSVSRPLQTMADGGLIELTRVAFSPAEGVIDPDEVRREIRPTTRAIVLTHATNVLGTIQPIAEVGKIARERGVKFIVDAAQTMGTVPIDIEKQKIDILAFPGHKSLLGPTGTGGVYVSPSVPLEQLCAFREGGGGDSADATQPKLFPYFLEGGTPNTVGIAGLGAAVEYVVAHGAARTLAHEQAMVQRIIDGLRGNRKFTLYGPLSAANRVGTLCFNIEGYGPQEAASVLDESFGIAVRAGLHCAPYVHRLVGTFPDGSVRISPGHFNTDAEVETLLGALVKMAG